MKELMFTNGKLKVLTLLMTSLLFVACSKDKKSENVSIQELKISQTVTEKNGSTMATVSFNLIGIDRKSDSTEIYLSGDDKVFCNEYELTLTWLEDTYSGNCGDYVANGEYVFRFQKRNPETQELESYSTSIRMPEKPKLTLIHPDRTFRRGDQISVQWEPASSSNTMVIVISGEGQSVSKPGEEDIFTFGGVLPSDSGFYTLKSSWTNPSEIEGKLHSVSIGIGRMNSNIVMTDGLTHISAVASDTIENINIVP